MATIFPMHTPETFSSSVLPFSTPPTMQSYRQALLCHPSIREILNPATSLPHGHVPEQATSLLAQYRQNPAHSCAHPPLGLLVCSSHSKLEIHLFKKKKHPSNHFAPLLRTLRGGKKVQLLTASFKVLPSFYLEIFAIPFPLPGSNMLLCCLHTWIPTWMCS